MFVGTTGFVEMDDSVVFVGFSKQAKHKAVCVGDEHILVHTPSSSYWGGSLSGSQTCRSSLTLMEVSWPRPEARQFLVESIVEGREPGNQWRTAKKELVAMFRKLEGIVDG